MTSINNNRLQGGKAFGILKAQQEKRLEEINKEFLSDDKYKDEEDIEEKLDSCKKKFMDFDLNDQGEIDMMGLKLMMEKLGVPKTHLQIKKMICEVTGDESGAISYREFILMLLGKRSSVLKMIMMFESKANENIQKPAGPPPRRDISSLP